MEIVTNPGSNVLPEVVAYYGIHLAPQRIIVGGTEYDTRVAIPYDRIDQWVKTSPEFPHVVGTSANEFALMFQSLAKTDNEILVITSSRKIIQSHSAATAAARSLAAHPSYRQVRVAVVDTGMTDAGAGLFTIVAGEAKRAGLSMRETVAVLERIAVRAKFYFIPATLEHLVKGGRASWVRSFIADMLKLRPLIGFVDGELKSLATVGAKDDQLAALVKVAVRDNGARRVWCAIFHSQTGFRESALAGELRRAMKVEYIYSPTLASSIYLHAGPGVLGIAVLPVDDLPWDPTLPPPF